MGSLAVDERTERRSLRFARIGRIAEQHVAFERTLDECPVLREVEEQHEARVEPQHRDAIAGGQRRQVASEMPQHLHQPRNAAAVQALLEEEHDEPSIHLRLRARARQRSRRALIGVDAPPGNVLDGFDRDDPAVDLDFEIGRLEPEQRPAAQIDRANVEEDACDVHAFGEAGRILGCGSGRNSREKDQRCHRA